MKVKCNLSAVVGVVAALASQCAGAAVRGAAEGHTLQVAPCAAGQWCTAREVAQAVMGGTPALPAGSATKRSYCEAAVAVAFGESASFDMATNKCPVGMPACFNSQAINQDNADVRGIWQMAQGNGLGSLTDQAQSLWVKYVGNQPGLTWDQAYCFNTSGSPPWANRTPIPNLPSGTGNSVAGQKWLFCKGAFTGTNGGDTNHYSKFNAAAKEACAGL
jgi:hypothetical protein